MLTGTLRIAERPRSFVGVHGPDAADFLQRMLSNDVEALGVGDSCQALLLTAKARVIAPLRLLRRSSDDFLLLTEPALEEVVTVQLRRARFASKVEIEPERHRSTLVLGDVLAGAVANDDYGQPGCELIDADPPTAEPISNEELELLRIQALTPVWGAEIDERILPAEAGLVERAVSMTKGCYPGQEPIARLQNRGHVNRSLRLLEIEGEDVPDHDTPIVEGEREVGRVTSSATRPEGGVLAMGYVRVEVGADAALTVGGRSARLRSS